MFRTSAEDIERAGDKEFRHDLDAFLSAEEDAELREIALEEQAQFLISPDQACYPWTFDHFEEAIGNASEANRKLIFATLAAAILDFNLDNPACNHIALVALRQVVEGYWLKCARHLAEKSV